MIERLKCEEEKVDNNWLKVLAIINRPEGTFEKIKMLKAKFTILQNDKNIEETVHSSNEV